VNDRIPAVTEMTRDAAIAADIVSAYRLEEGPQAGMTVVEVLDVHEKVVARSVVGAEGSRQEVADLALGRSLVERCGDWAVHPIGRGKRITAMVAIAASRSTGTLEAMRARQAFVA
jgi:hypothetical protein